MKTLVSDRRLTRRHSFKTLLGFRIWKSALPEQRAESENLSEQGIFFVTDTQLRIGATVEIALRTTPGFGVQFDCYQILRPKTL